MDKTEITNEGARLLLDMENTDCPHEWDEARTRLDGIEDEREGAE